MHNFDGVVFKLQMGFCCSCRLWLEVDCGLEDDTAHNRSAIILSQLIKDEFSVEI
jgi:hypothetical protein